MLSILATGKNGHIILKAENNIKMAAIEIRETLNLAGSFDLKIFLHDQYDLGPTYFTSNSCPMWELRMAFIDEAGHASLKPKLFVTIDQELFYVGIINNNLSRVSDINVYGAINILQIKPIVHEATPVPESTTERSEQLVLNIPQGRPGVHQAAPGLECTTKRCERPVQNNHEDNQLHPGYCNYILWFFAGGVAILVSLIVATACFVRLTKIENANAACNCKVQNISHNTVAAASSIDGRNFDYATLQNIADAQDLYASSVM